MYFKLNRDDLALKDCQTIRQLDPKSVYIKGHYLRGLTLLHLKKYIHHSVKISPIKNKGDQIQPIIKVIKQKIIINGNPEG